MRMTNNDGRETREAGREKTINNDQTIKQRAIEGLIVWEVVNGLLLLFLPTHLFSLATRLLCPLARLKRWVGNIHADQPQLIIENLSGKNLNGSCGWLCSEAGVYISPQTTQAHKQRQPNNENKAT